MPAGTIVIGSSEKSRFSIEQNPECCSSGPRNYEPRALRTAALIRLPSARPAALAMATGITRPMSFGPDAPVSLIA